MIFIGPQPDAVLHVKSGVAGASWPVLDGRTLNDVHMVILGTGGNLVPQAVNADVTSQLSADTKQFRHWTGVFLIETSIARFLFFCNMFYCA